MVRNEISNAITANGTRRATSFQTIFLFIQRRQAHKTTGMVTTAPLLSPAKVNRMIANRYCLVFRFFPEQRKAKMAAKKKAADSVFLSSAIHATEATFTG